MLVGAIAGLVAVGFRLALLQAEHLRTQWVESAIAQGGKPFLGVPLVAVLLVVIVAMATRSVYPAASGSGIPHIKGVLMGIRTLEPLRLILVKFIGGCLAIGAGLSLGREGPTVQMGGAIGHGIAARLGLGANGGPLLLAVGAGAGLSAAFNAPLAGFLFVMEELHFEFAPLPYISAFAASITADLVARAASGQLPAFLVYTHAIPPLTHLPAFILLGVASGLLAIVFKKALIRGIRWADYHQPVAGWLLPIVAGLAGGMAVLTLPEIAGGGHATSEAILNGHLFSGKGVAFILLLLVGKLLLTLISYFARVPGGIFAPMLVIGGVMGYGVGDALSVLFPNWGLDPTVFAAVGMASFFSGVVHAPLTGIALIIEMTNNFKLTFPMMVATLLAFTISEWWGEAPVYEALLNEDLRRSGPPPILFQEPITLHLQVETGSELAGRTLDQLGFPEGVLVVSINRLGHRFVPSGHTTLQPEDGLEIMISGDAAPCATEIRELGRAR